MKVAAIVVIYQSGSIESLIGQLFAQDVGTVVVVDNGASEAYERVDERPEGSIFHVSFGTNLGYGLAVNRGLTMIDAPLVLVVNPDVSLHPGAVDALVETFAVGARVGLVGPKVIDVNGQRFPSFRRFPSLWQSLWHGAIGWLRPEGSATRSYRMTDYDPDRAVVVPWISGACMLASAALLREVGGFDAKYHLYLEDVDLCRRVSLRGFQVVYQPLAIVTHVGATSSSHRRLGALVEHHRSMATYAVAQQRSTLGLLVIEAGIALRCGLSILRAALTGVVRN